MTHVVLQYDDVKQTDGLTSTGWISPTQDNMSSSSHKSCVKHVNHTINTLFDPVHDLYPSCTTSPETPRSFKRVFESQEDASFDHLQADYVSSKPPFTTGLF